MHTPLAGLTVLDASRVLAAVGAGQVLADLGATVLKLERPGHGDDTRAWGPPFHSDLMSAYFFAANRGKKSFALDLSQPAGLDLFHQVLDKSDALIENFRTDSAERMGLSAADLLARHPRLVACSITGFGHTGPLKTEPGYDLAIQGLSGFLSVTGPKAGPPSKVGVAVADVLTGLYAAIGILAGLRAREASGHGYHIDLALLDCAVATQINLAQAYLLTGRVPPRPGNAHFQIVPYAVFAASDGWLILNVGNDSQWQHFCQAAERPDLAADDRFTTNPLRVKNRDALTAILDDLFKARTVAEWRARLEEARVPNAPVNDYAAVFADEQLLSRGMKVTVTDPAGKPVDLIGSPFHFTGADVAPAAFPPRLGEHTDEVLGRMLGLDGARLADLRAAGIVA
ncbi:MAG TPA: CaiB/BaiF CoA-transferase family protein [Gemmataceae bacterium]|nr:CaiB/BaiF CoA-transferase family protein [Gemmataceae bacterium]